MTFSKIQSQIDLRRTALFLSKSTSGMFADWQDQVSNRLSIRDDEVPANWKLNLSPAEFTNAVEGSCSPDAGVDKFRYSTCLVLIDKFENPSRNSDFLCEWDAFKKHYRSAPAGIRSAIMNGLFQASTYFLAHEDVQPSSEDRMTLPRESLMLPLVEIAKRLVDDEARVVAKADYGRDEKIHYSALKTVLANDFCQYPPDDCWFPAEVVELVSHGPTSVGFLSCTAIVLLNALNDGDKVDHAEFRWSNNYRAYRKLAENDWIALAGAFRHLYETLDNWDPFEGKRVNKTEISGFLDWQQRFGK